MPHAISKEECGTSDSIMSESIQNVSLVVECSACFPGAVDRVVLRRPGRPAFGLGVDGFIHIYTSMNKAKFIGRLPVQLHAAAQWMRFYRPLKFRRL